MRPEDTKMTEEEKQAIRDAFGKAGEEIVLHAVVGITTFVLGFWGLWELMAAIPPH